VLKENDQKVKFYKQKVDKERKNRVQMNLFGGKNDPLLEMENRKRMKEKKEALENTYNNVKDEIDEEFEKKKNEIMLKHNEEFEREKHRIKIKVGFISLPL
jgi:hypothetical protein